MKSGLVVIGAVLLTSTVAFGQQSTANLGNLDRKFEDAQYAMNGVDNSAREQELQFLRDELGYLRVKARRRLSVTTTERQDLSARLDRFTTLVNAERSNSGSYRGNGNGNNGHGNGSGTYRDRDKQSRSIPVGTEVDVRLVSRLSSNTAMVEDRVETTTLVDLYHGSNLLVPAGSVMIGQVTGVDKATRMDRKGSLTVAFTRITVNGRAHDIRGSVTQAIENGGFMDEAPRVGVGAGVGAIIGGLLGGVKGAIAGVLIGGSGVLVATEGKDVDLDPGTVLRVRFDSVVTMTEFRE